MTDDWKQLHANEAEKALTHPLVLNVIEEFMDNVGLANKGLPAYGIRKVAFYAATVARAQTLGFDPDLLRYSAEEGNQAQLELAERLVRQNVPVTIVVVDPEVVE